MGKKKASARKVASQQVSFEESLTALEQIVAKLEGGKLELGESLEFYEQGVKHLKSCYALLNDAERRIELVSGVDAEGNARTEEFSEDQQGDLKAGAAARGHKRTAKSGRSSRSRPSDGSSALF